MRYADGSFIQNTGTLKKITAEDFGCKTTYHSKSRRDLYTFATVTLYLIQKQLRFIYSSNVRVIFIYFNLHNLYVTVMIQHVIIFDSPFFH